MIGAIIGSAAAPVLGGIIGNIAAGGDQARALEARQAALGAILGVRVPTVEEQQIALQLYEQQGIITPELEALVTLEPSAMEGVSADPRLKESQMRALAQMEGLAQGGLRPEDLAGLSLARRQVSGDARARDQALLQERQMRGVAGSGDELAARLGASQAAANRQAESADRLVMSANQRALEAMAQSGSLASGLRTQDVTEQSNIATAKDRIAAFNAQNRQRLYGSNVDRSNIAQESNLQQKQRVADMNVLTKQEQEKHNKALIQQKFENEMRKAGALSGAHGGMADHYSGQAAATRGMWSGIGSGVGQGIASYGTYKQGQDTRAFEAEQRDKDRKAGIKT